MSQPRYNKATIAIHWLTLLLMIAVYCTMEFRGEFERGSEPRELMKTAHYMLGLSIFLLTFIRLALRFSQPYPAIEPPSAVWQHKLAALTHLTIYAFMIAMPLLGWLILSAEGKVIPFFGLELPALIAPNEGSAELFEEIHELVATFGYALIGLHAVAAIFHHYIVKDNTLKRMSLKGH